MICYTYSILQFQKDNWMADSTLTNKIRQHMEEINNNQAKVNDFIDTIKT